MASEPISIAGRTFRYAEGTSMDQDGYVITRMKRAGLYDLASGFNMQTDDIGKLGEEMILQAFESGALYEILAGIFVEDGIPWSRKAAADNARFFGALTDPTDKKAIYAHLATVILDFLLVADAWSKGSLKSSSAGAVTIPDLSKQPSLFEDVQRTISENGTISSEMFPSTT